MSAPQCVSPGHWGPLKSVPSAADFCPAAQRLSPDRRYRWGRKSLDGNCMQNRGLPSSGLPLGSWSLQSSLPAGSEPHLALPSPVTLGGGALGHAVCPPLCSDWKSAESPAHTGLTSTHSPSLGIFSSSSTHASFPGLQCLQLSTLWILSSIYRFLEEELARSWPLCHSQKPDRFLIKRTPSHDAHVSDDSPMGRSILRVNLTRCPAVWCAHIFLSVSGRVFWMRVTRKPVD